jgi:hypothetical protein
VAGHWLRVENGLLDLSKDLGYDWLRAKSGLLAVAKIVSYELRKAINSLSLCRRADSAYPRYAGVDFQVRTSPRIQSRKRLFIPIYLYGATEHIGVLRCSDEMRTLQRRVFSIPSSMEIKY